jgi:Mlc titration factor MtfA (ptsG expression regulator)
MPPLPLPAATVAPFPAPPAFAVPDAALAVLAAGIAAAAGAAGYRWFSRWRERRRRREAWLSAPLPNHWRGILRRRFPTGARLPPDAARRHRRHMKRFLSEKTFTACGGLRAVGDEMAVTIAARACLLLAGHAASDCFPTVHSVLVYPDTFRSKVWHPTAGGAGIVGDEERVGEASPYGSVVLSWREILRDCALAGNGHDVVIHEFAHHIEPSGRALRRELDAGFRALRAQPADPVLDDYGAESAEEFWAVSVEAFFEAPVPLREAHPAWYRALADFFALDPAAWE